MASSEESLKVLSLNCWGLYLVSKQRRLRLKAIANYLSQQDHDVIALQEVWVLEDYEYIKTMSPLPYSNYFYSGTLGSGLVLLSRFPILSTHFLKFTLSGRPLKVFQGDFYVGKGLASVCIEHPTLGLIDIYTTHLQAGYGLNDDYEAQRITQCWQIVQSVRSSIAQGKHVILTGDINSIPTSHCYKLLKYHGFLTDSWLEVNRSKTNTTSSVKVSESIERLGITCDSPLNTWSKHFLKQVPYEKELGDRLDYIFYFRQPEIDCVESKVAIDHRIPNTDFSFSDHFAVESVFKLAAATSSQRQRFANPYTTQLQHQDIKPILSLIDQELTKAKQTSDRLLVCFALSILVVLAGVCYSGQLNAFFSRVLLVLFSVLCILSLIVGFVFGKTEQNSLIQFKLDLSFFLSSIKTNSVDL